MKKVDPITVEQIYLVKKEKAWKALTNKDELKLWFFNIQNFEPIPGKVFTFYEPNGTTYLHECKITEVIPFKKLQYSWAYPEISKGLSLVTWNIEEMEEVTRIQLIHENIQTFSENGENFSRESFEEGWKDILHKGLKKHLSK